MFSLSIQFYDSCYWWQCWKFRTKDSNWIQDKRDVCFILNITIAATKTILAKVLYNLQRYYIIYPLDQWVEVSELERGKMNSYCASHHIISFNPLNKYVWYILLSMIIYDVCMYMYVYICLYMYVYKLSRYVYELGSWRIEATFLRLLY